MKSVKKSDLSKSFANLNQSPLLLNTKSSADFSPGKMNRTLPSISPKKKTMNLFATSHLPSISIHRNPLSMYSHEEMSHTLKKA